MQPMHSDHIADVMCGQGLPLDLECIHDAGNVTAWFFLCSRYTVIGQPMPRRSGTITVWSLARTIARGDHISP